METARSPRLGSLTIVDFTICTRGFTGSGRTSWRHNLHCQVGILKSPNIRTAGKSGCATPARRSAWWRCCACWQMVRTIRFRAPSESVLSFVPSFLFSQLMDSGSDRCEVGHCSQQAETENIASSAKIALVPVVTRNLNRGGLTIRAKYTMCGHLVVHTNQHKPEHSAASQDPPTYLGGVHRLSISSAR